MRNFRLPSSKVISRNDVECGMEETSLPGMHVMHKWLIPFFFSHFTVTFDTSPPVLARLNETLRSDPGIIRWTMLKKGSTM
jgi:hypothetical protein